MLRVRVALSGWPGGPGLSTFYFGTLNDDAAAAVRVVEYVHSAFTATWNDVYPPNVSMQVSGDVDVLDSATGAITDTLAVTAPAAVAGVASSEFAPIATALLARLTTPNFIAGRRLRGRIYFCPIGINMVQGDGTPDPTAIAFIQDGGNTLLESIAYGDVWEVWHRPVNGVGGQTAPVISVTCPDKFSILTSRRD